MKFASVKPAKLSDAIVDQIERLILNGVLVPGERLPAERELAKQFEVSRPPLREALMRLEAKGLVYTRRGGGTYVMDVTAKSVIDPLSELVRSHPETIMDILELRYSLEEMAAFHAARRATDQDIELIKQRYASWVATINGSDLHTQATLDLDFHMSIADASHNVALILVMRSLFKLLQDSIHRNLEKISQTPDSNDLLVDQHRQILDAISARDPETARQAASRHLSFVSDSMRALDLDVIRTAR